MINFDRLNQTITNCCNHYEKSAPIVSRWLDQLYVRIDETPENVVLTELMFVVRLENSEGIRLDPNSATNQLYHLQDRLSQDTTGNIGY